MTEADSERIDLATIKADAEWLIAAGPETTEEAFNERWDRFYELVTPELVLQWIEGFEALGRRQRAASSSSARPAATCGCGTSSPTSDRP